MRSHSSPEMDAKRRVFLPAGNNFKQDFNEGDLLAVDQLGDGTIIIKSWQEDCIWNWKRGISGNE
jgi:hypothetical protein